MSNISFSSGYGEYINGESSNYIPFELKSNDVEIFSREFISNSDSFVDLDGDNFLFTDHNFVTGEELVYTYDLASGNTPIGIAETTISGILTSFLPKKLYAVKDRTNTIQVAYSEENSLLSTPIVLDLVSYGTGTHRISSKNPNKNTLITVNNVIQDPIVSTSITSYITESISNTDSSFLVDNPYIFEVGSLIKINEEICRILSVGVGTENNIIVQRGFVGTERKEHNINSVITKIKGSYNIVDNFIHFIETPYANIFDADSGLSNGSTFSGRVFLRSGTKNTNIGPYDTNYIFDDISTSFDGQTTDFTLKQDNLNVIGFSTYNAIVTVNDVFQAPSRLIGNPITGAYVLAQRAGISSIRFTGNDPFPTYDVNTSQLPRGGILFSVGSIEGFGYQPLISAGGTAIVSTAGTIQSISIGYSGSGYRSGIQTVNVGVALSDVINTEIEVIGTAVISNGEIIGTNITNPGSGYTFTNPPTVIFDAPLSYTKIPLIYSTESIPGDGVGATVDIEVGQDSSVINFNLSNLGYAYKSGEILTVSMGGTTGIPTDISKPFDEFQIIVDDVYTDTAFIRTIGQLTIFDPIDSQFNNQRKSFPLRINGEQTAILSKTGFDINVENCILVFIDGVLQVPGEGYSFSGGSILTFNEAPRSGAKSTILFYAGTGGIDTREVKVLEVIQPGDTVQIFDNTDRLDDQNPRTVTDIVSVDTVVTNLYGKQGISETNEIRPIKWCPQDVDKFITSSGSTETSVATKDRIIYEPLVYPVAYLIKDANPTDTIIHVDNVKTFFDNVGESPVSNDIFIISQDPKVTADLTANVSTGGSITGINISNPGFGYTAAPQIRISSPVGLGTTAIISSTIDAYGQIDSITIVNSGTGYTTSSLPRIIVEKPKEKVKVVEDVVYEGDFGIISGVGTTTISGSNIVVFDFYIPNDSFLRNSYVNSNPSSLIGISGIYTGCYFHVSNSNVGNSIISLTQADSVIGIGTSFMDNVYEVFDFSIKEKTVSGVGSTSVNEVLVKVQDNSSFVGINSGVYYGDYSWGKIYLPQVVSKSFDAYPPGITTSALIQRNYLKYADYLPTVGGGGTVTPPPTLPTLSSLIASPISISVGGTISVAWSGASAPSDNDWIAAYENGETNVNAILAFVYTPGTTDGSVDFVNFTTPGEIVFRYLPNNGYISISESNVVDVIPPPTLSSLTATPSSVSVGDTITVSWTGASAPSNTDRIASYASTETDNNNYISILYTPGTTNGSVDFENFTTVGEIVFRYLPDDTLTSISESNTVDVVEVIPTPTLSSLIASPTSISVGGTISVAWTGASAPSVTDRIASYASTETDNNNYISILYTDGGADGSVDFENFITVGEIVFRYLPDDGIISIAESNSVDVSGISSSLTLIASPSSVSVGDTITVSWTGVPDPTINDAVGAYTNGELDDNNYLDLVYSNDGAADGSVEFVGLSTVGEVVFRYLPDTFISIVESNVVDIIAPTISTLTATPSAIDSGESITVSWTGVSDPKDTDWIGAYLSDETDNNNYLDFIYTSGISTGSVGFNTFSTFGEVLFRYLVNDTTISIAESNTVDVAPPTIDTLTADPTSVFVGDTITVSWTGVSNPTVNDSITAYINGETDDSLYQSIVYTDGSADGSVDFVDFTTPGEIVFRYISNNVFTSIAESNVVEVTEVTLDTLVATPSAIDLGDTITVNWTGATAPSVTDRIAAYLSDETDNNNYIAILYTDGSADGSVDFDNFSTFGEVLFRYLPDDGTTSIAESNTVDVAPPTIDTLTAAPTTNTAGDTITVSWTGASNPSISDRIAAYISTETNNNLYISILYTDGSIDGSVDFTNFTTIGEIVFRYLPDNTFTSIAESNSVTVDPVASFESAWAGNQSLTSFPPMDGV